MKPTLLVLAAGMGSRYGGLKQLDTLGPSGETIIDYSIYDAIQAGFGKVVYIVREYFLEDMKKAVAEKYANVKCLDGTPLQFDFVCQELHKIPAGYEVSPEREKPWGTAHAILAARDVIEDNFIIINADDYYGKEAFKVAASYLKNLDENAKGQYANIVYKVSNTMTENGSVKRAVCLDDGDGMCKEMIESNIERDNKGNICQIFPLKIAKKI